MAKSRLHAVAEGIADAGALIGIERDGVIYAALQALRAERRAAFAEAVRAVRAAAKSGG